ncbi:MAG: hypothetical protein ACI9W6_003032 [Motiliproteus sp.]|jgi:hypothetical protein
MKFDPDVLQQQLGFESLEAQSPDAPPPVNSWHPPLSGDIDLFINRQGEWFHEGTRFERKALAKLFGSILRKEGDDYFVLTPVEKWRIRVEDVPFSITRLDLINPGLEQRLELQTSLGDSFCVDAAHPLWLLIDPVTDEPSPYVRVRDRLDGMLARSVFYELVSLAAEHQIDGKTQFGIHSGGQFFAL